jgi:hypothetical protein
VSADQAARIDLDEVQAHDAATMLRNIAASAFHVPASHLSEALNALELGAMTLNEHVGLVAELRAAHNAVEVLREGRHGCGCDSPKCRALAAYDQVVGGGA